MLIVNLVEVKTASVNSLTAGSITATAQTISTTGLSGTDVNLNIGTQNNGVITLTAQAQMASNISLTANKELATKKYVDGKELLHLQTAFQLMMMT